MTQPEKPADHPVTYLTKAGVLMVNLGTPDAPTTPALRKYLAEFLWDPRIVEVPRPVWWLVLNGFILPFRPRRSAAAYRAIWTEAGSPLLLDSRRLCNAVARRLPDNVPVALGMRYGNPSLATALGDLTAAGVHRFVVLPLFPQYSATTVGSVFDAVTRELSGWRWVPQLSFINSYHDDPGYIAALAKSIDAWWREHGRAERLLFSFHGIPTKYFYAGDPYHCQCQKTARLVAEKLNLDDDAWIVAFQSRFGPQEWLKPYTDEVLEQWARQGLGKVQVISPGFAVDCLETLEEIAIRYAEQFRSAGGDSLEYIPALNASDDHADVLAQLIRRSLSAFDDNDAGAIP